MNNKLRITKDILDNAADTVLNRRNICFNMLNEVWIDPDTIDFERQAAFISNCFPDYSKEDIEELTELSIALWSTPSYHGYWAPLLPILLERTLEHPEENLTLYHYMLLLSNSMVFSMVSYLVFDSFESVGKDEDIIFLTSVILDTGKETTPEEVEVCLEILEELGLLMFDGKSYKPCYHKVKGSETELLHECRIMLEKFFLKINPTVAECLLKPFIVE